ncbi:menaquinol oxidoreductase [candidate division GN15 bacterium]|nr:menaquinol oxidoreductase [candidate division GN15 bacterium]
MIEKALSGSKQYWAWVTLLLATIAVAAYIYIRWQWEIGLGVTGLSRDVTWGFYIAQFTFMVGVAASAVMVVLPYYLHDHKEFGKITILGEFIAIASVVMCMTFIFVDMGQPFRILNVFLHPSPNSLMFWDTVVLSGYLVLNVIISVVTLDSERKGIAPPKWIKPVIILSIPWAFSIHTVTAFLYSGLAARPFWLTAILAPRFLASAFATGPALLILLVLILRKVTNFDAGKKPVQKLAMIATYAMAVNVFFVLMEIFTAVYSDMPEHTAHFRYLFVGLEGHDTYVAWMWMSVTLAVVSLVLLINPKTRRNESILTFACIAVVVSLWIDKGLAMVVAGFIPTVLGDVVDYVPTLPELMISLGIYALGLLLITVFYRMTLSVRRQLKTEGYK